VTSWSVEVDSLKLEHTTTHDNRAARRVPQVIKVYYWKLEEQTRRLRLGREVNCALSMPYDGGVSSVRMMAMVDVKVPREQVKREWVLVHGERRAIRCSILLRTSQRER
jgi:hypothetical protein